MEYTAEGLGLAIKDLREGLQMSQEALGVGAEYGKGAGVSISRIESGQTVPTKPKLAGIAGALGVTVGRLEESAAERSHAPESATNPSDAKTPTQKLTVRERSRRVEARTRARIEEIDGLASAFDCAHQRARDEFFLPFVTLAEGLEGVQETDVLTLDEAARLGAGDQHVMAAVSEVTSLAIEIKAAIAAGTAGAALGGTLGASAAYATYMGVARLGEASTGVSISALSGVARSNATLSVIGGGALAKGGGGIVGGTRVLTALVATPIVVGGILGAFLIHRRSKVEEAKLSAQLDASEAELEKLRRGFDLLTEQLPKATGTLEYIGTYAAHALKKWEQGIGDLPIAWADLSPQQQLRYHEFITIAGCEVAIDSIETAQFLTTEGNELEEFARLSAATLGYADTTARTLV